MSSLLWQILLRAEVDPPRFSADEVRTWFRENEGCLSLTSLLRQVENATSVVCDACAEGHVEEVRYVRSPRTSPLRAYIYCPENERVQVPLDRLKQWDVDLQGLATGVASALELAGTIEEIVSGRVWSLGKATIAGRSREVFLARGLKWVDAPRVIGGCERLNAAQAALVFVPGAEPQAEAWKSNPHSIVSMKIVAELGSDDRLELDRNHLESVLSEGRRRAPIKAQKSFPTPAGVDWRDVTLSVTDTHVTVEAKRRSVEFSFAEAGFEEKRTRSVSDTIWGLLKVFGMRGGMVPVSDDALDHSTRINLKQYMTVLRKRLRALIPGIDGDPVPYDRYRQGYRTAFRITSQEIIRFPTPIGTLWAQVSITLRGNDTVYISVPDVERYRGSTYVEEQGKEMHQWETGERETKLERGYDLRTLQLADDRGQSNRLGTALIDVLQGQGVVKHPIDDKSMLDLCGFLTKLMGIKDSPFDFAPNDQKWVALFEASSEKR